MKGVVTLSAVSGGVERATLGAKRRSGAVLCGVGLEPGGRVWVLLLSLLQLVFAQCGGCAMDGCSIAARWWREENAGAGGR